MEEEKKKLLFLFVFSTYLPVFLLKFQLGELPGCKIKLHIQQIPARHTSSSHFLGISCFWGSGVHKKYAEWVLIGCGITNSPDRNLSKNTGRYVKNTNKKSSFFMITIPKFILKKCLRPIRYLKIKAISLANT